MSRSARIVIPGLPHHITQRGNNRAPVFLDEADFQRYLELLRHYASEYQLVIHGYCLMSNHSHLIVTPATEEGLAQAISLIHARFTHYSNRRYQRLGHLWQNRFYSCPLDESHYWNAVCYVERNPVRAGLESHTWHYPWSSAAAHVTGTDPSGLLALGEWGDERFRQCWQARLGALETDDFLATIRIRTHSGLPLGDRNFIRNLEHAYGRVLHKKTAGRTRKDEE